MSKSHYRFKPAAIVGTVIALSIALADSAIAETDTVAKAVSTAKVRKIARSVANQEINARAPGLSVGSAVSANPVLFARVLADGTVDSANSKGISQANVQHPADGFYCFSGPPGIKGGQVTIDFPEALRFGAIGMFGLGGDFCLLSPPTQFFVLILNTGTPGFTPVDSGFFLLLYQ